MGDNVQQQGDGATALSSHRSTGAGTPPSSASSDFKKGVQQVELELRLLEALAIYRPSKLADEVLQLLDRFFNLEHLKPDDDELDLINHEEEFSLPSSIFEDTKGDTPILNKL